jgi:hypothetical protein
VTCIWVGLEDDEIVSGHLNVEQHKLRNVRRDPRVALSIEGTEIQPPGLKRAPGRSRQRAYRGRRGAGTVAAARPCVPGTRGRLPADGRPASGVCAARHRGAGRRSRAMERGDLR